MKAEQIPPILFLEPSAEDRRGQVLRRHLRQFKEWDRETLREHLTNLRRQVRRDRCALQERFRLALETFPGVQVTAAADARDAAGIIWSAAVEGGIVSVNNSSVVINELQRPMETLGLKIYRRYGGEFPRPETGAGEEPPPGERFLPGKFDKSALPSFTATREWERLPVGPVRNYTAVMGVNAASAADGSFWFLQHMTNIARDVAEARQVFFIVALEKIVPDRESALLQTRAMGIFGLETVAQDMPPEATETFDPEAFPLWGDPGARRVHVILLDHGRNTLAEGEYEDLFHCIDCRACVFPCPIAGRVTLESVGFYSPKNAILANLQGAEPPLHACLHCGRCEVACPVGIDLPSLIWKTQIRERAARGAALAKRLLDNPEWMMKIGTCLAPLANVAGHIGLVRLLMEKATGIHRSAFLPAFRRGTFRGWYRRHGG